MKSVVQEASSIAKAIEQAWKTTGEPRQFSVKILELAQKNFFGFTSRPAKIAFFFEEELRKQSRPARSERRGEVRRQDTGVPSQSRRGRQMPQRPSEAAKPAPAQRDVVAPSGPVTPDRTAVPVATRERRFESLWNDEMLNGARAWLSEVLVLMGHADVNFSVEVQQFHLRITLSRSLVSDESKEKHLLASLSTLMLATLKKQFRKALRGHKIVLVHENSPS
ncbi:MAG: hypothetical protein JW725_03005 [Candidatus Babeliaceae bacterium]|nr:hypothetical protein [Candidatus Babeliaceae bacterium]